jgi:hypothetical protein
MGSWGERPYDNDTAADWFGEIMEVPCQKIEELLARPVDDSHYDEYRAAAWFLSKIGRNYVYPTASLSKHLSGIHDRLQTIRNDSDWLSGWKRQDVQEKDLDDLIQQVQRVCKWNNVTITF